YGAGDLTAENVWVVDPIDGTRSFISGHPLFGFLLAHMKSGQCEFGMISMPALDEQYVGQRGKGATLNGTSIKTSGQTKLSDAILYVNEGEKLIENEGEVLKSLLQVGHTKRFGYDCYPHALVASGQIDAVVDYDLKPFDYLPLAGVIEEAGGIITDWNGDPLTYTSDGRVVSAATSELHRELISILSSNGKA
ncbi:MAG: inositol monophosphatase, partial [Planctomycetaceae bacterium]|nr:inositol monophosphatase [Planctomycetaceae bacterium]